MGVVLIMSAWPKKFACVCIYNPTILKILDPPLSTRAKCIILQTALLGVC